MSQPPAPSRREVLLGISVAGAAGAVAGAAPVQVAEAAGSLPEGAVGEAGGTIVMAACRSDGRQVMRAYSWSPTGYALVEDGRIIDQVGTP